MAKYDPWAELEQSRAQSEQAIAKYKAEQQRESEWKDAWHAVLTKTDIKSWERLGEVLRERECGPWLDYLEVNAERDRMVLEQGLRQGFELNAQKHAYRVLALQLLRASFMGDMDTVRRTCFRARTSQELNGVREQSAELRDDLSSWVRGRELPATPYMSRSELAVSLRRKIKGFGKSDITKKVDAGELIVLAECRTAADGKTQYAQFRHREVDLHAKILGYAVAHLKKIQKS